ncbi:MAG: M48 family metallopeptidase [Thainema sp.]
MVSQPNVLNYRVRESRRAKHVSIRISLLGEVEVVVPKGFDQSCIPDLVQERRTWITRTVQQLRTERQSVTPEADAPLPDEIILRSPPERWQVVYQPTGQSTGYQPTNTQKIKVSILPSHHVLVTGDLSDQRACRQALQHWLRQYAKAKLVPWLEQVSQEVQLPFQRASVRGQRTRWASCSNQQTISLNYKLLFLPPDLVRYVFIHELCHTQQMNHSSAFWSLVEAKEANYRDLDANLRKAWRYVPAWAERKP